MEIIENDKKRHLSKEELKARLLRAQAARRAFSSLFKKKKDPWQDEQSDDLSGSPFGKKFIFAKYERRNREEIEAGF